MKSLKSRRFIGTTADIVLITREYLHGAQAAESSRGTYLTVLIATVQDAIGVTPRVHAGKPAELTQEEVTAHLKALKVVHKGFFASVRKTAREEGFSGEELNKKIKFASSSASTLKSFIKAGGDLRALVAERETKPSLRKATKPIVEGKPYKLERAVTRYAREVEKLARACDPASIDEAIRAINRFKANLDKLAAEIARPRGKGAEKAVRQRKYAATTIIPHRVASGSHTSQ